MDAKGAWNDLVCAISTDSIDRVAEISRENAHLFEQRSEADGNCALHYANSYRMFVQIIEACPALFYARNYNNDSAYMELFKKSFDGCMRLIRNYWPSFSERAWRKFDFNHVQTKAILNVDIEKCAFLHDQCPKIYNAFIVRELQSAVDTGKRDVIFRVFSIFHRTMFDSFTLFDHRDGDGVWLRLIAARFFLTYARLITSCKIQRPHSIWAEWFMSECCEKRIDRYNCVPSYCFWITRLPQTELVCTTLHCKNAELLKMQLKLPMYSPWGGALEVIEDEACRKLVKDARIWKPDKLHVAWMGPYFRDRVWTFLLVCNRLQNVHKDVQHMIIKELAELEWENCF